ncbi:MAG: hypothetical protein EXX96DRAFT_555676 [Benjaminiella poitrasii]|nr:MAG: hypothetical protein EXX96DRAFT_555676 [Benjaminiella poitrasii]
MSDYSNNHYSTTINDNLTKSVPLYHHEQVPFYSYSRPSQSNNNMTANTTTFTNHHYEQQEVQQQQQQQQQQLQSNPATSDLQDIIMSYQSQPELLRLILTSKLEEDKRRAEEAKLRSKELDLLLTQQQMNNHHHSIPTTTTHDSIMSSFTIPFNNNNNTIQPSSTPPLSSSSNSSHNSHSPMTIDMMGKQSNLRRTSIDAILSSPHSLHKRELSTMVSSSLTTCGSAADSDDYDDPLFNTTNTTTHLQLESYNSTLSTDMMSSLDTNKPSFIPDYSMDESMKYDFPPRPRRRREMQAITKIVETREYPYNDGYFWKNNGNTIQKKTGNKSVYYKCSNSNKGCPVNKTVTWKDHGEYLIKYRGDHLQDCNKVQRIVDV